MVEANEKRRKTNRRNSNKKRLHCNNHTSQIDRVQKTIIIGHVARQQLNYTYIAARQSTY